MTQALSSGIGRALMVAELANNISKEHIVIVACCHEKWA
jgi:hypothetical protein